jgi:hypothetical protein
MQMFLSEKTHSSMVAAVVKQSARQDDTCVQYGVVSARGWNNKWIVIREIKRDGSVVRVSCARTMFPDTVDNSNS